MRATAAEVGKNFGQYADKALVEPVAITKHGREHLVLMSAEQYAALMRDARRHWPTSKAPADVVDAVKNSTMDKSHDHLDELLGDWTP